MGIFSCDGLRKKAQQGADMSKNMPCMNPKQTNYYDTHYRNCVLEPIKVMAKLFTPEEFKGFLKGCILKYRLRLGNKIGEDLDKELAKIQRYEQWLKEAEEGKEITV